MSKHGRLRRPLGEDRGFGMVEVVVALLLFAVMAMATVPLLIRGYQASSHNSTIATANQLAMERLELARSTAIGGTCAELRAAVEPEVTVTDGRGVKLKVSATVGASCTQTAGSEASQPRLASVTAVVRTSAAGFSDPVIRVSTQVFARVTS